METEMETIKTLRTCWHYKTKKKKVGSEHDVFCSGFETQEDTN